MANQFTITKFLKDMHKYYTNAGDNGRSISYGNAYSGWVETTEEDMSVNDLVSIVESDEVPGFGPGTKSKVLTLLDDQPLEVYDNILKEMYGNSQDKDLLGKADVVILPEDTVNETLSKFISILNINNIKYDISGPIRRGIYSPDIEILIYNSQTIKDIIAPIGGAVIIYESTSKFKFTINNLNITIRYLDIKYRGCSLIYYTGSDNFNLRMRKYAKSKSMKLTENNIVFNGIENYFNSEEEVFTFLGLNYIKPEDRK
jgi:DNA polymerase/3'-5' exonuclease PolX